MQTAQAFDFEVFAQNRQGTISESSASISVTFDPSATSPEVVATCNGADPFGCSSENEICDNGRDDNCDGLRDEQDPQCQACENDVFERNDDVSAPRVEPIRHEGLVICPNDDDFYGIFARAGDVITVRLLFLHEEGDLDMNLLGTEWSQVLERSESTTDDERIVHTAMTTGEYKVHVFGAGDATNRYVLDIGVNAP
jgi:hypothetical protein